MSRQTNTYWYWYADCECITIWHKCSYAHYGWEWIPNEYLIISNEYQPKNISFTVDCLSRVCSTWLMYIFLQLEFFFILIYYFKFIMCMYECSCSMKHVCRLEDNLRESIISQGSNSGRHVRQHVSYPLSHLTTSIFSSFFKAN